MTSPEEKAAERYPHRKGGSKWAVDLSVNQLADEHRRGFVAGYRAAIEDAAETLAADYTAKRAECGLHLDAYSEGFLDALDIAEQRVHDLGEGEKET